VLMETVGDAVKVGVGVHRGLAVSLIVGVPKTVAVPE